VGTTLYRNRALARAIASLVVGFAVATINGNAQDSQTALTCTNPVSGTSWQIMIDYRSATVDAYPATITPTAISWFDPKDGGHYRLDRNSGRLSASVASSTGGFARHAHCDLDTAR
jgi:hypothetical protein